MEIKKKTPKENFKNSVLFVRNVDAKTKERFVRLCEKANMRTWEMFKKLVDSAKIVD